VHLDLNTKAEVRQAFEQIAARLAQDQSLEAMEGVLVQPMVTGGVEVMAGMVQDPSFGPLIGFGLGGIHRRDSGRRALPNHAVDGAGCRRP
jgi:acyl-CoA synthetase (NDP forming)